MTSLMIGATAAMFGGAILADRRLPKVFGVVALAGGVPLAIAGVAMAYTGFSELAMSLNLASFTLLLLWMLGIGVSTWRGHRIADRAFAPGSAHAPLQGP